MSAAPFDINQVITRLRATVMGPESLRQVSGAAEYASVQKLADFPAPCAYVLLAREKAETHPPGNGIPGAQVRITQRVIVTFGVVLAVRNYRDQAGGQSVDELNAKLTAIRGALLGWIPYLPGARPCLLLQGDLTQYSSATSLWTDVYQTQHMIGGTP